MNAGTTPKSSTFDANDRYARTANPFYEANCERYVEKILVKVDENVVMKMKKNSEDGVLSRNDGSATTVAANGALPGGGDGGGAKAKKVVSVGGTTSSTFVKPSLVSLVLISSIFVVSVVTNASLTVSVSVKVVNSTLKSTATPLDVCKVFLLLLLLFANPAETSETDMIVIAPGETFKTDAIALINIAFCSS